VIAYIEGTLVRRAPDAVVAVPGGIALDLQLAPRLVDRLPAVGESIRLWTHLAVREDEWILFGFLQPEERQMFRLLISVKGIGPRVALAMLSAAPPETIARYLRNGDEKSLAGLPGIGKKGAARLVLELGQRIPIAIGGGSLPAAGDAAARAPGELHEPLAILVALGLPAAQAESALQSARRADPALVGDTERWVKAALSRI
jgi:Holliday junction DNA helicase RuvA